MVVEYIDWQTDNIKTIRLSLIHTYRSQMHTSTNLQFMLPVVAVAMVPGLGEHIILFVIGVKSNMCCPIPAHSVKLTAP